MTMMDDSSASSTDFSSPDLLIAAIHAKVVEQGSQYRKIVEWLRERLRQRWTDQVRAWNDGGKARPPALRIVCVFSSQRSRSSSSHAAKLTHAMSR